MTFRRSIEGATLDCVDSLFAGQWAILKRVAQGAPQAEVLDSIVRLIESQAAGMLCSILLFDEATQTLRHGAAPHLPREYVQAIDGATIGPAQGSCGAAAHSRQPVIVEDTSVHPNWKPWRELARRNHLRACWSTPIFATDGSLVGTFAMYYAESRVPSEREKTWIATATHLTSIAMTLAGQAALQERLEEAQRMEAVGRLAAGVAHDFNNLLLVIMSYSELLTGSLDATDPRLADLRAIDAAAYKASQLTRQLLALGRQQVLAATVIDLNRLLLSVEKTVRQLVGAEVNVSLQLTPGPAQIRADAEQLEQVVMNLVINARDAMPEGGALELKTEIVVLDAQELAEAADRKERWVALLVTDTGHGMDEATRARAFEPFFSTKHQDKGTGLGLASVWGTITQSGGRVSVTSAVGRGTTFKILFPSIDSATASNGSARTASARR